MRPIRSCVALALVALSPACAHDPAADGSPARPPPCPYAAANDGTQSYDILCHDPVAHHVKVKHILLGWRDLASAGRETDLRAIRSKTDAQALARDLLQRLRGGAPIEPLMAEYSEDPGSAQSGRAYDASPDAALVSEFKSLAVRLQVHEAGIVESSFGLHVIQRVE